MTMRTLGCYRRHYLAWEHQHQQLLSLVEAPWEVPSQTLLPLLDLHGYQVRKAHLARGRLAEVDFGRQVVRVACDLPGRLQTREREREVLASTLAHELAHVVLHEGKRPQRVHEDEAWVWSTMFLAPWWMLARRPEVQALDGGLLTERQQWTQVYALARSLGISASITRQALDLYEVGGAYAMGRAA